MSLVSTWMGDRLGTLGAVGFINFFVLTPLFGDRRGFMPPQLKTISSIKLSVSMDTLLQDLAFWQNLKSLNLSFVLQQKKTRENIWRIYSIKLSFRGILE